MAQDALESVWRQPGTCKQYLTTKSRDRRSTKVIFFAKTVLRLRSCSPDVFATANPAVKILSVSSDDSFVTVLNDKDDTLVCDIVVGDGWTYSAFVRASLTRCEGTEIMDSKDKEPMKYSTICLIGQTRPLNDARFPIKALQDSQFIRVFGNSRSYSYLNSGSHDENNLLRTLDWGQATVNLMCEKVKDIPIIAGGYRRASVGHLFDLSDRTKIKRVAVEEKVFSKWHYRRAVLIGNDK